MMFLNRHCPQMQHSFIRSSPIQKKKKNTDACNPSGQSVTESRR
uniref:Uncharacterized protein n=1 Tax=Arundo donax TaxID=35708 RepID=A0A0A9C5Y6_ARUDO